MNAELLAAEKTHSGAAMPVVARRVSAAVGASRETTPYLSVVIPAYNEARWIQRTLEATCRYLDHQLWDWEIIVSADGDDGTREQATAFAAGDPRIRVIGTADRGGKGRGVRNGVLAAKGQFVGFLDADYKTPISEFDKILPWLRRGFGVVVGSRRAPGARIGVPRPFYRRLGSAAFALIMRNLVGLRGVKDTQCGFKFFTREVAQCLFSLQRIDGYMFDVEVLRLARILGYRIKEVGVRWQDDGDSRYHPLGGTWTNARELIRIRRLRYPMRGAA